MGSKFGGGGELVRKRLLWPPLEARQDEAKRRNVTEAMGPSSLGAGTQGSGTLDPEPRLRGLPTEGPSPSQAQESAGFE